MSGAALARQNVVLPAGDQKIGAFDFMVTTTSTPLDVDAFNNMPIKQVGNAIVYLRDVAFVHRGPAPQANIVLVKGHKAILLEVLEERQRLHPGRGRRHQGAVAAHRKDPATRACTSPC